MLTADQNYHTLQNEYDTAVRSYGHKLEAQADDIEDLKASTIVYAKAHNSMVDRIDEVFAGADVLKSKHREDRTTWEAAMRGQKQRTDDLSRDKHSLEKEKNTWQRTKEEWEVKKANMRTVMQKLEDDVAEWRKKYEYPSGIMDPSKDGRKRLRKDRAIY